MKRKFLTWKVLTVILVQMLLLPFQETMGQIALNAKEVKRIKLLPPGENNPRNSEGDFIKLNDGSILFVYTHFTSGADDDAKAHLAGRYSYDNGITWTNNDVIIVANEGDCNVMSVSLLRLQNNKIALFYLIKNSDSDCRLYMRTSNNEARTWSKPVLCEKDLVGFYVTNNDRVVQLKSGRLLNPVALHSNPVQNKFDSHGEIICFYSDNNGKSWKRSATTQKSITVMLQEPGVIELKDGRIMMFCRTDMGYQYVSYSSDEGITWSEFVASNIISPMSPASIERIPSTGDLLLVWNNSPTKPHEWGIRTPFTVAISKDEGKTWINMKTIEDDPAGWYCYTAIEFVGDRILLAHCAGDRAKTGNGLETTQITSFPVSWLYEE